MWRDQYTTIIKLILRFRFSLKYATNIKNFGGGDNLP